VQDFVDQNWAPGPGNVNRIDVIPGVLAGTCPSAVRFLNGLRSIGGNLSNGTFAWHATPSEAGVTGISDEGFDPKRRSGQVFGPGEYFAKTNTYSHGYAKGLGRMFVAYVLKNPAPTTEEVHYVVNNPLDWGLSFCVPIAVVSYGKTTSSPTFKPHPAHAAHFPVSSDGKQPCSSFFQDAESTPDLAVNCWRAPFRWHWTKDDQDLEPYSESMNTFLERLNDDFRANIKYQDQTPLITRYLDDIPHSYFVDLKAGIQKHSVTGYVRAIKRLSMTSFLRSDSKWQYLNENQIWTTYDPLVTGAIEGAYRSYISGNTPSKVTMRFPGRSEQYILDFIAGQQENQNSRTSRNIRRL